LLTNQESTWDVLQETNRVLIEKRNEFSVGTSFVNWSLTVARYQVMAWLRDQKRDRHILTPELAGIFSNDKNLPLEDNQDVKLEALQKCIQTLSITNQNLVRLRYSHGGSLAEISTSTQTSVNALKQSFFRIRKSLFDYIERRTEVQ
jgi:RNA polymerase sigma-70 factor (ECF subfamily)